MPEIFIIRAIDLFSMALQNEVYLLTLMANNSENKAIVLYIFAQICLTPQKLHIHKNYLRLRIREI